MDKKQNLSGAFLALVGGVAVLAAMLIRAFLPSVILPRLDIIAVVVLSLAALLLEHYIVGPKKRAYWLLPFYAALVFGLFPYVGCFLAPIDALKAAAIGAVAFTAIAFLFDSILNRISLNGAKQLTPIIVALGIYLASQGLSGII